MELAEEGFPVAEVTAQRWEMWATALRSDGKALGEDLLIDGHPPRCGQVFKNPSLAQTIKVKKQTKICSHMCNTRTFSFYSTLI